VCVYTQEAAERELAKLKRMLEETRLDWQKKLKERRREVGILLVHVLKQLEHDRWRIRCTVRQMEYDSLVMK